MSSQVNAGSPMEPAPRVPKSTADSLKLHFSSKSLPRFSKSFEPIMLSDRLNSRDKVSTFQRSDVAKVRLGRMPTDSKGSKSDVVAAETASSDDLSRGFDCRVMSQRHASISWNSRGAILTDHGSTHGTFISSMTYRQDRDARGQTKWTPLPSGSAPSKLKPNEPWLLNNGDLITFGKEVDREGQRHQAMRCIVEYVGSNAAPFKPASSNAFSKPSPLSTFKTLSQPAVRKPTGRYGLDLSQVIDVDDDIPQPKSTLKPLLRFGSGSSTNSTSAVVGGSSSKDDSQQTVSTQADNSQSRPLFLDAYRAVNDRIQLAQHRMEAELKRLQEDDKKATESTRSTSSSSINRPANAYGRPDDSQRKLQKVFSPLSSSPEPHDSAADQPPNMAGVVKAVPQDSLSNKDSDEDMEGGSDEEVDEDDEDGDEDDDGRSVAGSQDMDELSDATRSLDGSESGSQDDAMSDAQDSEAERVNLLDDEAEEHNGVDDEEEDEQDDEQEVEDDEQRDGSQQLPEIEEAHQECYCFTCAIASPPPSTRAASEDGESQDGNSQRACTRERSDAPEVEERAYSVLEPNEGEGNSIRDAPNAAAIAVKQFKEEHDPMLVEYAEEEEEFDEFEAAPGAAEPSSVAVVEPAADAPSTATNIFEKKDAELDDDEEEGVEPEDLFNTQASIEYNRLVERLNKSLGKEQYEPGQLDEDQFNSASEHDAARRAMITSCEAQFNEELFVKNCTTLPTTVTAVRKANQSPRHRSMLSFAGILLNITRWQAPAFKSFFERTAADDVVLTAAGHDTSVNALLKRLNVLLLRDLRSGRDMPIPLKEAYMCYAQGANWKDYRLLMLKYVRARCVIYSEWDLAPGWEKTLAASSADVEDKSDRPEYPTHPAKPAEWLEELNSLVDEEAAAAGGLTDVAQLLAESADVKALRAVVEAEAEEKAKRESSSSSMADEQLPPPPSSSLPEEPMPGTFVAASTAADEAAADSDDSSVNASSSNDADSSFATQGFGNGAGDDSDAATSVADASEKHAEPIVEAADAADAEMVEAAPVVPSSAPQSPSGTKRSADDVAQEDESIDSLDESLNVASTTVQAVAPAETRPAKRRRSFGAVATAAAAGAAFGAVSTFLGLVSIATLYRD